MKNKYVILAAVVLVLVLGYYLYFNLTKNNQPEPSSNQDLLTQDQVVAEQNSSDTEEPIAQKHEVVYTGNGFTPAELEIKMGDTVVFKNQSSAKMWVASAMHPTHIVYGGTSLQAHCPDNENNDFDQCQSNSSGESWEFTFNKSGEWGYHNHSSAQHFGKIIVR